jgi:hypothetical protein
MVRYYDLLQAAPVIARIFGKNRDFVGSYGYLMADLS